MITPNELFTHYEVYGEKEEVSKASKVLTRLHDEISDSYIDKCLDVFKYNSSSPLENLLSLKNHTIYSSPYVDYFFSTLSYFGYKSCKEICDFMISLLNIPLTNSQIDYVINKFKKSPYIDDITYTPDRKFTISSKTLGDFHFQSLSYYMDDYEFSSFLSSRERNRCHLNAVLTNKYLNKGKIIGGLMSSTFNDIYCYHSANLLEEDNIIIDSSYRIAMDVDEYNRLFDYRCLLSLTSDDYQDFLNLTLNESNQPSSRYEFLKMTLFNHSLNITEEEKNLVKKRENI